MLREGLEGEDEARSLPFVASARAEDGVPTVAGAGPPSASLRSTRGPRKEPAGLFTLQHDAIERIGVFVLLAGDLDSYHPDISEEVFRGVALADDVAPFVVINDNDAMPRARSRWSTNSRTFGPAPVVSVVRCEGCRTT